MRAEVEAIGNINSAVFFAAGCVFASIKERVLTMDLAIRSVRIGAILAMLALAVGSALSAGRTQAIDPHSALVFALSSACFAAAGIWSFLRGPITLVQAASSMTFVYTLAWVLVRSNASIDASVNAGLYRALTVEGVVIWAALLGAGLFVLRGRTSQTL